MNFFLKKKLILIGIILLHMNLKAQTTTSADQSNQDIIGAANLIYKILTTVKIDDFLNEVIRDGQYNSIHLSDPHAQFVSAEHIHKFMTLNAYLFPQVANDVLVAVKGPQDALMKNTLVPLQERIERQAHIIKRENPDVVLLQEVWGNSNQKHVVQALRKTYPYYYYEKITYSQRLVEFVSQLAANGIGSILEEIFKSTLGLPSKVSDTIINDLFNSEIANPIRMRDGLIIMSKYPILNVSFITFKDKMGDENFAEKGALIALIGTPEKPVLFINTHLQSGRSNEATTMRKNQMKQIGEFVSYYAKKQIPIMIAGDMNEPINYNYKHKTLIDRGNYFAKSLNDFVEENYFSTNEMVEFMANHMPQESPVDFIASIDQLSRNDNNDHAIEIWKHIGANFTNEFAIPQELYNDLIGFSSAPFSEYKIDDLTPGANIIGIPNPEFKYRTVSDLGQMLERVITSPQIHFNDIKIYRSEFLGGENNQMLPYNFNISDHSAVLFTVDIN